MSISHTGSDSFSSWHEKNNRYSITRHGRGLEKIQGTSCRSGWPRGFGALKPCPHTWIFTSVWVDSNPRAYLFTSPTVRILRVHTRGTEPIRPVAPLCRRSFAPFNNKFIVPKAEHYSYLQVVELFSRLKGVRTSWNNLKVKNEEKPNSVR